MDLLAPSQKTCLQTFTRTQRKDMVVHAACSWNTERPGLTWQRFMDNKNKELKRLNGVYMKLLEGSKVDYHEGRGRVVDAHTVEVDGRRFTVRACASWVRVPGFMVAC